MAGVENRVVGMDFDNASFEKKLEQTIASLDRLNQTLEKQNGKKALEGLTEASKGVDMSHITAGIEGVSAKFLALSTIGITALANITTAAIHAGVNIVKSLSLDQVISGFQEYETNMNSIQTIMSNTRKDGTTLDQVNDSLKQLNEYSDKTIYNFGEMARNIGTFTAAGVDLGTSVESIKGIANLAAASGSNSQQAASAMYQLSQALASGTVKLMDWNSVVNAGMGGEMFQEALFNAGKLKGTLDGVDAATTFTQWKDAGNTFRDSLESGWITADVLTSTLQTFTGDLSQAQIQAMGYTQEQAAEIYAMGQDAKAAATEVKTFTQLIGTVKEAVGSGWSESFKLIIGDFEEAKAMFTGVNNAIGEIVGNSAKKRNELLQGWKDLGGRTMLIDALSKAFSALQDILAPIGRAFRNIFPPMTAQRLADLTWQFRNFIEMISPSTATILRVQRIFEGVFAALEIGWTVIKETANVFGQLFSKLTDGAGGGALKFLAEIGDKVVALNASLVAGGGIEEFFNRISYFIQEPEAALRKFLNFLGNFKDNVFDFLSGFSIGGFDLGKIFGDVGILDRIGARFETLRGIASRIIDVFQAIGNVLGGIWDKISPVLDSVFDYIHDWFSELGGKLADATSPEDFNNVVDVVNVGLLGGITAILAKFLKNGIGFDLGGGVFDSINKTFGQLTGTLKTMQMDIKANALLKIAGAVGILTASVLVLSLIDSVALTKSLTAMAVGFGQLLAAFAILNQIGGDPKSAASMTTLAVGLGILAGAILLLSASVYILSTLSWNELATGLTGVTVILGALIVATKLMDPGGMIRSGIGLTAIAIALGILAISMKIFATMSWAEMAQGFVGVAGGLAALGLAMQLMPKITMRDGASLLMIATAMNILALAMKAFATMSWGEMAKGFVGVGGGLVAIALAMSLMPPNLLLTAAGLVLVSGALLVIGAAMKVFASMSWGEIAKGIGGMAAALLVLAVAATAMSGAILGAVAIGVMAASLFLLVGVLKSLAQLSLAELGVALLAVAGILAVLAAAALLLAPAIFPMMAFGAALALLGLGLVLFGAGAALTATAFATLAKAGQAGITVLLTLLDAIITRIPELAVALAEGLITFAMTFIEAAPVIIESLGIVLEQILQTIVDLTPDLVATVITLISGVLLALSELYPQFVSTGLGMLIALLTGIRDNIGEITTLVIEIIVAFVDAVAANLGQITDSAINLLTQFLLSIANKISDVTASALAIVVALAKGVSDNVTKFVAEATNIVVKFLEEIGRSTVKMIAAGTKVITDIITGIGNAAEDIVTAGADAVISFLDGVADNALKVVDAGFDIIVDFLNGIASSIRTHSGELRAAGVNIATAIISGITGGLSEKVGEVANGAINLAKSAVNGVKSFLGINSPSRVFIGIGSSMAEGLVKGLDEDTTAENAAVDLANRTTKAVESALKQIPAVISGMDEFNPTITPVLDLTQVKKDAGLMSRIFQTESVSPLLDVGASSTSQARTISNDTAQKVQEVSNSSEIVSKEVKFEQNIHAPSALSTADIYRQTRNLVALAKEELEIV